MGRLRRGVSIGVTVYVMLFQLSGEGLASFYGTGFDPAATILGDPGGYLVQETGDALLGPFDPFWASWFGTLQPAGGKAVRKPAGWQPVALNLSQGSERSTGDDEVNLSSGFGHPSSGGSGGGSRGSPTELLASSSTGNPSTASATEPPDVSYETGGAAGKDGEPVPNPLPPSVFLLGSGLLGLFGLKLAGRRVLSGEERESPSRKGEWERSSGKGECVELSGRSASLSAEPRAKSQEGVKNVAQNVTQTATQTATQNVTPACFQPGSRAVGKTLNSGRKHAGRTIRGSGEIPCLGPRFGFFTPSRRDRWEERR